jgi:hypothetical protein
MSVTVFGIRHHGPGSAKSLVKALETLQPDCILIEGPPEADEIISLAQENMLPPVALLIYLPEMPKKAVVYPFAIFSPEWQAIQFGLKKALPISFMDLPQYYQLKATEENPELDEEETENKEIPEKTDPIGILAEIAGYSDGEVWWDNFVENRKNDQEIFSAISEMMTELRRELALPPEKRELQREAYMRKSIRKAKKAGFRNIAVVCGAWHVPALIENFNEKEDEKLLKELTKVKTQATWIPWTHSRLSYYSGYGAGIESPGWYQHLWTEKENIAISWLAKVANLLREKDLEVSSAHIIEAVRLAEMLAIMRDKNLIGLTELNEATQAIICGGSTLPLKLITEKLIIGNELGKIPDNTPLTPIQQDFFSLIKKLRLKMEVNVKEIDLDLRKENDLEKSYLLHRLKILSVNWGKIKYNSGSRKGTFHELWDLEWKPEFSVLLIEAGIWGNTLYDATNAFAINIAQNYSALAELTALLEIALVANIPEALEKIMKKLQDEATLSSDVEQLMVAVPPMANILRYGNVRKTDSEMVKKVLDGLILRICINLPKACSNINYDASNVILEKIIKLHEALKLLQEEEYLGLWYKTLLQMSEMESLNGLINGYACRLLFDNNEFNLEKIATKMSFALSLTGDIENASIWLEGFLKGSGLLLVHNEKLLSLINNWLVNLSSENFMQILPILRRNFSSFSNAEKRQIGEMIKNNNKVELYTTNTETTPNFSYTRAKSILPVLKKLLGVAKYE